MSRGFFGDEGKILFKARALIAYLHYVLFLGKILHRYSDLQIVFKVRTYFKFKETRSAPLTRVFCFLPQLEESLWSLDSGSDL